MKIGIITFHFVSNQGGVMQCYALQKYLEKQGHEAVVVDYRPLYHTVRYSSYKDPFLYSAHYWKKFKGRKTSRRILLTARSFARALYMNVKRTDKASCDAFEIFTQNKIDLTRRYTSYDELKASPPEADAYICGSDQLWNPDLLYFDFDPAYFLNFGDPEKPHIAYAVSTGRLLSEAEISRLKELSRALTAVSFREYSKEIAESIGHDIHICLDPTLLLDRSDYEAIESAAHEQRPYIFVYGFENTDDLHQAIEAAKKKYQCRVINGCPHRIHLTGDVEERNGYGPDEFLSLIRDAECVVTNSFHGTAFAVIYKKDFITVTHTDRGQRMKELLQKLELKCRLWNDKNFSFDDNIDYDTAYDRLRPLRKGSEDYLRLALAGERGEGIPHYKEEIPENNEEKKSSLTAYYGYHADREKHKAAASGGALSAIAEKFITAGGTVYGVEYADDFKTAHYICVENMESLKRLRGSKYIYPDLKTGEDRTIFDDVEEKLKEGRRVLFVGLGCITGGLQARMRQHKVDTDRLFTIDLICHGPVSSQIQPAFVESLEKKYRSKIVSFDTRYVKKSWIMPYVRIQFENGRKYLRPLYETDLGFALKYYCRESCYNCMFKGDAHAADLTAGDFWGLKPGMKEYDPDGVSILFCRTEKGEKMVKDMDSGTFIYGLADGEYAAANNRMLDSCAKKPAFYSEFGRDLIEKGLHYAVRHSKGYRIFIKAAIKNRYKSLRRASNGK